MGRATDTFKRASAWMYHISGETHHLATRDHDGFRRKNAFEDAFFRLYPSYSFRENRKRLRRTQEISNESHATAVYGLLGNASFVPRPILADTSPETDRTFHRRQQFRHHRAHCGGQDERTIGAADRC